MSANEPPHVHVERDDKVAKFWLRPVELADGGGFGGSELRKIRAIVIRFEDECWDRWHAYFERTQND